MNLKRHKQFLKDWNKTKLTDGQFTKFIEYSECLRLEKSLPEDSKDHSLQGEYKDCRLRLANPIDLATWLKNE